MRKLRLKIRFPNSLHQIYSFLKFCIMKRNQTLGFSKLSIFDGFQILGENGGWKSGFQIHCTQFMLFLGLFGQYLLICTTLATLTNKLWHMVVKLWIAQFFWDQLRGGGICSHSANINFFNTVHWNVWNISDLVLGTHLLSIAYIYIIYFMDFFFWLQLHMCKTTQHFEGEIVPH